MDPPDPAPEYTEWVDHRYDPGYYLGGRIPPYLRRSGKRRNWYGYVLIVGATMAFILAAGSFRDAETWWLFTLYLGIAVLQFVAGVKLTASGRDGRN